MPEYQYQIKKAAGRLGGWRIDVYFGSEKIAWNSRLFKSAAVRYGRRKIAQHKASEASKETYYA